MKILLVLALAGPLFCAAQLPAPSTGGTPAVASGGTATSKPRAPLDRVFGISPQQYFGSSVTSLSDFDRDGVEDFAVAIPCDNQNRQPLSGSVKIYGGSPSVERLNLQGEAAGDLLGGALARIPDLDGDGIDELLVGAPGASPRGRASGKAYVFSGADAHILFYLLGEEAGDEFGAAVSAVGDLDGDGVSELAVASPGARSFGRNSGSVFVFDGKDAHVVFRLYGDGFGERFGTSVAGAGDMNGDGKPEIAVGAPCPRLDRPGYVRILSGADAEILYTFGGEHTWELFGTTLAPVGDADGDGHADLLVGAPVSRTGAVDLAAARDHACGAATLFSGGTGKPLFTLASQASEDRFGSSLALGPDLDGDGVRDFLVGATQRLLPRAGYVRAYAARGGAVLATWTGASFGEQFGAACAVLPSKRGAPLLVVGSPTDATHGGSGVGLVSLFELAP
ncbi:MAG TPA: integrin alpha [Planctomycetota bacterium]|nr:integrin alpha [Planctomycetota bacterium]